MDIKNSGLDLINYEIWYEPFWKTKNFCLLISIVSFFIIIFIFILLFKKIKNKKIEQLSNIDKFYYKIDLLSKNKTYDVKKFYIELILILKEYLSSSLNYDLFANTDDEIINSLKKFNLSSDFISKLAPILSRAQIAKFANCVINKDQILQDLVDIKLAVESFERANSNAGTPKNL